MVPRLVSNARWLAGYYLQRDIYAFAMGTNYVERNGRYEARYVNRRESAAATVPRDTSIFDITDYYIITERDDHDRRAGGERGPTVSRYDPSSVTPVSSPRCHEDRPLVLVVPA